MTKSFSEVYKSAKYKLPGNGPRTVGDLMKAFENIDPSTSSDIYGTGGIINDFESEIAKLLGKEKAVFFPSGTMAQQIALRIWCDKAGNNKVAYHPLCHLEIHERDGLKVLHHLDPILLGDKSRLFTIEDLNEVKEPISCLLIELPQREIGGQLPSFEELMEISQYCKSKGIKLHLDGARLFEALPYYNKTASEICSLFDSVYVSFYKGLGGIAGAVLAGGADYMEEAKVWKRRHGGDLISLYPYIVNAKYSMDNRMGKMKEYWQHSLDTAARFNKIEMVKTQPEVPFCNMFHAYFHAPKDTVERIFIAVTEKTGLAIISNLREINDHSCMSEVSFGDSYSLIPQDVIDKAFQELELDFKSIL
jgi:threonine aldolase